MKDMDKMESSVRKQMEKETAAKQAASEKAVTQHTVASGDSLSSIALKYYGSGTKEKWMIIYIANKSIIGSDPGNLKVGQVLRIPDLD